MEREELEVEDWVELVIKSRCNIRKTWTRAVGPQGMY